MAGPALVVEATITGPGVFTSPISFRGRVNVYVEDTAAGGGSPWSGWVHLQRRFTKGDGTKTSWETVAAYNQPGNRVFVEHENVVDYRLGVPADAPFSGGTPYARLSQ